MARNRNNLPQIISCGIDINDAKALRRISMTLRRWHEMECGDSNDRMSCVIERDEKSGKPFRVVWYHNKLDPTPFRYPVADRERGALKRLAVIMSRYPNLNTYVQGDPRGCALHILRPGDVPEGKDADAYYSRGVPVY
jgi:hypothetical protein